MILTVYKHKYKPTYCIIRLFDLISSLFGSDLFGPEHKGFWMFSPMKDYSEYFRI